MESKTYFTVVTQEEKGQPWAVEFGSFSKREAHSEMMLLKESGIFKKVRILTTSADQNSIDAARKALPL